MYNYTFQLYKNSYKEGGYNKKVHNQSSSGGSAERGRLRTLHKRPANLFYDSAWLYTCVYVNHNKSCRFYGFFQYVRLY